jgi:hypothetical protein
MGPAPLETCLVKEDKAEGTVTGHKGETNGDQGRYLDRLAWQD